MEVSLRVSKDPLNLSKEMDLELKSLPCTFSQVHRLYNTPFSVEAKRTLLRIREP